MYKLLFIEDDSVLRENTAELLELNGYEVITAPNGKVGLELAQNEFPNLIICDIMMPELDGYEVLQRLSHNSTTRNIPFIFLSAKTERSDVRKGMDLGADDYLTKPFEEEELISAVESRLAKAAILKEQTATEAVEQDHALRSLHELKNYIDDNGSVFSHQKGDEIYRPGDHANYVYLVLKGVIKTYQLDESGKELTTSLYKEDDLFGYNSLLDNSPHKEFATALEDIELAGITKEQFLTLINDSPKLSFDLIALLSDSLNEVKEQLMEMAYGSVRRKTALTILKFAEKMNKKPDENLKIARHDLANVAGIATESLIRTLSSFNKEGLVAIEGRNIKILQLDELKQMM